MSNVEVSGGPLNRFFQLLGFELDLIRSKTEALRVVNNPAACPGDLLPLLAAELGVRYESNLGMEQNRQLLTNLVDCYKAKGSVAGIEAIVEALTGWSSTVAIGPNIVNVTNNVPMCTSSTTTLKQNQFMGTGLVGGTSTYSIFGPTLPLSWYTSGYTATIISYVNQISESFSGASIPARFTFSTAASTNWTNGAAYLDFNSAMSPNTLLVDAVNYGIPVPSTATALSASLFVGIYPASSMAADFTFVLEFFDSSGSSLGLSSTTDAHSYSATGAFDTYKVQDVTVPDGATWFSMHLQTATSLSGTTSSSLSTGSPITSIPVHTLSAAFPAGAVTIVSGSHSQTFTTTGAALSATSIPVTSQTPNYAYPSSSTVFPDLVTAGEAGIILAGPMANVGTTVDSYSAPREIQVTLNGDRENLMPNPSFEGNATTGWTGTNCTLATYTGARYVGGIVASGATTSWTLTSQPPTNKSPFIITVPAGTTTQLTYGSTAAVVAAAIEAISGFSGTCTGSGGPVGTANVTLTFSASQSAVSVTQVGQNLATNVYSCRATASGSGTMSVTSAALSLADAADWLSGSAYVHTPTTARNVTLSLAFYESDGTTLLGTIAGMAVAETIGNWVRPFACTEQSTTVTFAGSPSLPQPAGTNLGGSISPNWASYIASTAKVKLIISWASVATSEVHDFDAVLLEASDTPGTYFDGDYYDELEVWNYSDYQWAGGTSHVGPSYHYKNFYTKFKRLDQVLAGEDPTGGSTEYGTNLNIAVPGAPTQSNATLYNGAVGVVWTAPSSDGGAPILGYNIYMGNSTGEESTVPINGSNLIPFSPYVVTDLANSTEYFFTVKAVTEYGTSAASNEKNAAPTSGSGAATVFQGPGHLVTVWEIPGEYNNPTVGATSGLVLYSGQRFGSGNGPLGIIWVNSIWVPPGVIV